MAENKWLFCWKEPASDSAKTGNERSRYALFDSADDIADKILSVLDRYNKGLSESYFYGAMDFEGDWLIVSPGGFYVTIEDLPCYVSDTWLAVNSDAVIA